ncbi:PREDICTED: uncharacterized protein LOC106743851 [Dinoponera quadriceps]|uniref:phospholipase A2 n=1 Tax=Dinoponera quadriceps TaxID=609295 RepID=A0A6P3X5E1_DINQU|nr:PREDICTED: uncharacterized protein LOC106743851 [Dinoponera quadriceps]
MYLHFCLFAFLVPGVVVGYAVSDKHEAASTFVSIPTNLERLKNILNDIDTKVKGDLNAKKEALNKIWDGELRSMLENSFGDHKEYLENIKESILRNSENILAHPGWKKIFEEKPEEPTQFNYLNVPSSNYGDVLNEIKEPVRLIFPGTKWCGDGDIAEHDEDLGRLKQLDMCCRAHDKCKISMVSGAKLGNLWNEGKFTKSACMCDFEFYDCLKATNSIISWQIGKTYFNILGPQCFYCVEPANGCNKDKDSLQCLQSCYTYGWLKNKKY